MASKPKRQKMSKEPSTSTNPTENLDKRFYFVTSDFTQIVKSPGFVDKTLLIKDIFQEMSIILITAPRRYGKSTNLHMVKKFVQIQVDEYGVVIGREKSSNRKIFKGNNLLVFQDKNFFKKHFATYPVIHANFKSVGINADTNEVVLKVFGGVLKDSYSEHKYLLASEIWSQGNLNIDTFKKYIDSEKSKSLDAEEVKTGLKFLSKCLYRHFGKKKVFVLIDEYDAPIQNTTHKLSIDLNQVQEWLRGILTNTLKENECVERALITGCLYLSTEVPNNMKKYLHLHDHPLVKYYCLME